MSVAIPGTTPLIPAEKLFKDNFKFDVLIEEKPLKDENLLPSLSYKILDNFYPFTQPLNPKTIFYIYPNDYNRTNLLSSKYTLEIKETTIQKMIEKNANISLYNNEMECPLSLLVKNTYYPGISELKRLGVDINRDNFKPTYDYLQAMYISNKNKMISNDTSMTISMNNFIQPQYHEIKQIIQSNEAYFNNIILNLELSFSICNYLTQQYLFEMVLTRASKFANFF